MFALAPDLPERLRADPFEAILPTGTRLAAAGTAIAGPRWTGGSFDRASGRGGALTPLTQPDLAPIPTMTAEAGRRHDWTSHRVLRPTVTHCRQTTPSRRSARSWQTA